MKEILLSGCSFTAGAQWPYHLFPNSEVINLAVPGAGNDYISQSIIHRLTRFRSDFVFVLWSGFRRIDLRIPKDEMHPGTFQGTVGETTFVFSGGDCTIDDRADSRDLWLGNGAIHLADQYFRHQYGAKNQEYLVEQSSLAVMNCHNFLDKMGIDYRFGWIYDIFSDHGDSQPSLGPKLSKHTQYLRYLDWEKFIPIPPLEWSLRNGELETDQFHPTEQSMIAWADSIRSHFPKDFI